METTIVNDSPLLDLTTYYGAIELKAGEQKTVDAASKRIVELETLKGDFVKGGRQRVKDYTHKVSVEPTAENIERLAWAAAIEDVSDDVGRRVKQALAIPIRAEIDKLTPVACRVIDSVADQLRADFAKHQDAVGKSPFAGDVSDAEAQRRLDRTIAWLEEQRGRVHRDNAALQVLQDFGLVENPWLAA